MVHATQIFGFTPWQASSMPYTTMPSELRLREERRLGSDGMLVLRSIFDRDERGRCTREVRYDDCDRPVAAIEYYGNGGRLDGEIWTTGTGAKSRLVEYDYNPAGLLTSCVHKDAEDFPLCWTEYTYGSEGLLISARKVSRGSTKQSVALVQYASSNIVEKLEFRNGEGKRTGVLRYIYDPDDRLYELLSSSDGISDGGRVSFAYDCDGSLISHKAHSSNGALVFSCVYVYESKITACCSA